MQERAQFKFHFYTLWIFILCWGCQMDDKAQEIVDRAIAAHGGKAFDNLSMQFDFRDRHYRLLRENGHFTYEREFQDSLGRNILDRLTNEGFERWVDGEKTELDEEKAISYRNSVNSVMYFMLLPYGLNDKAVHKKFLGEREIKGSRYDLVKVTFSQSEEVGDHQDTYLYWFDQEDGMMDYLAYEFFTEGGGIRFREAIDRREVEGIMVQDYNNYKAAPDHVQLDQLDSLFVKEKLELLSKIVNENVQITLK